MRGPASRDVLRAVAGGEPEFGPIRLWSQWEATIHFGQGPHRAGHGALPIRCFSRIGYTDSTWDMSFEPPVNDLGGMIPAAIFGLEASKVDGIELGANGLVMTSGGARIGMSHGDRRHEAIHVGDAGSTDHLIL